jgi:hypothetical protein
VSINYGKLVFGGENYLFRRSHRKAKQQKRRLGLVLRSILQGNMDDKAGGDSSMLYLPVAYMATMVAFTGMRKAGLQRFLKPHQVTIAGAVGVTVALYGASYLGMVPMHQERVRAVALLAQSVFFTVALNQRNELPRGALLLSLFFASVMCSLAAFNALECDRYANLVLFIESLLLLGSFLAIRSAEGPRKHENVLHGVWAVFCFGAMMFCESETMNYLYLIAGMGALLVSKISHPLMGDKLSEGGSAENDPETTSWRM